MALQQLLTPHQSQYFAWLLTRRAASDTVESPASTLVDAQVVLSRQKKQRELESKRSKLRRELFARQDEVEAQRNDLIEKLESQLGQRVQEQTLFTVEWELR